MLMWLRRKENKIDILYHARVGILNFLVIKMAGHDPLTELIESDNVCNSVI